MKVELEKCKTNGHREKKLRSSQRSFRYFCSGNRASVVKRCIHTSADFDYAKNLVFPKTQWKSDSGN